MNPPLHTSNASLTGDRAHRNTGNKSAKNAIKPGRFAIHSSSEHSEIPKNPSDLFDGSRARFCRASLGRGKSRSSRLLAASATSASNLTDAA